jgi:hypothetical protein
MAVNSSKKCYNQENRNRKSFEILFIVVVKLKESRRFYCLKNYTDGADSSRFKERKKAMRFNLIGTLSIQCGTVVTLCRYVGILNSALMKKGLKLGLFLKIILLC